MSGYDSGLDIGELRAKIKFDYNDADIKVAKKDFDDLAKVVDETSRDMARDMEKGEDKISASLKKVDASLERNEGSLKETNRAYDKAADKSGISAKEISADAERKEKNIKESEKVIRSEIKKTSVAQSRAAALRVRNSSGQFMGAGAAAAGTSLSAISARSQKAMAGLSRASTATSAAIAGTGRMAMKASLGIGIAGYAAKRALDPFAQYEANMNTLQVAAKATGGQMAKLGTRAKELGADVDIPGASARDASEAMLELTKAGLSVNQTMTASKGTMVLAAAAQTSNAEAAVITGDALNAFSLEGSEAIVVADTLAGAANASSGNLIDYAYGLKSVATIASTMGVNLADTTTSLAMMAKSGLKGQDAGTSLKAMLLALSAPSALASKSLKEIGVSVFDSEGKMRDYTDVLDDLRSKTQGMTDEARSGVMKDIFGTDGLRAANILLKSSGKEFDDLKTKVTASGQAANMAKAQNKGLQGAFEQMANTGENALIQLGEALSPILTPALKNWASQADDAITKFFDEIKAGTGTGGDFVKTMKDIGKFIKQMVPYVKMAAKALFTVLKAFLAMPAPVQAMIVGLGGMFLLLPKIMAFASAIGKFISILKLLRASFMATRIASTLAFGPIGIAIMALVAIGYLVYKNWDMIVKNLGISWKWLKKMAINVWGGIKNLIGKAAKLAGKAAKIGLLGPIPFIIANWKKLSQMGQSIWNGIKDFVSKAARFAGDMAKKGLLGPIPFIITRWNDIIDFFKSIPGRIVSAFKSLGGGLASALKGAFKGAINGAIDIINNFLEKYNGIELKIPEVAGIGGGTIGTPDIPLIPRLAQGGEFSRATFAIIGEDGSERVVPTNGKNKQHGLKQLMLAAEELGVPMMAKGGGRRNPDRAVNRLLARASGAADWGSKMSSRYSATGGITTAAEQKKVLKNLRLQERLLARAVTVASTSAKRREARGALVDIKTAIIEAKNSMTSIRDEKAASKLNNVTKTPYDNQIDSLYTDMSLAEIGVGGKDEKTIAGQIGELLSSKLQSLVNRLGMNRPADQVASLREAIRAVAGEIQSNQDRLTSSAGNAGQQIGAISEGQLNLFREFAGNVRSNSPTSNDNRRNVTINVSGQDKPHSFVRGIAANMNYI